MKMGIKQKLLAYARGENTCPRCGAIHYLMIFGIFNRLCPICFDARAEGEEE